MAYANFNELLMETKRKATLSGRPVSKKEVAGITEGIARVAPERLAELKRTELAKKTLAQQKELETARLTEEKRRTDLQVEAAREAKEEENLANVSSTVGAGIGFMVGGPVGAAVGATAGQVIPHPLLKPVAKIASGCIIISVCTTPNSYEVNITREFRDNYLGSITLAGYYKLAQYVVPLILISKPIKMLIKKVLVDNLVEYGEWILGYTKKKPSWVSTIITRSFLRLIKEIGNLMLKAKEA